MENSMPISGWRGSPDIWLSAAHQMLIESGIESVSIQGLAKRLKLSRTSFYWHFLNRQFLLTALTDRWAKSTTLGLIAACEKPAKTETQAMLNVIGCFFADRAFDSALEFAIRAWAQSDPKIMTRLLQEDAVRMEALIRMFQHWGHTGDDAETRARTVYLTQIGYISMRVVEQMSQRMARIPHYVHIYTGLPASMQEFAHFQQEHDFKA